MYNVVVFIFIPVLRPSQGSGEEKEVGNKGGRPTKGVRNDNVRWVPLLRIMNSDLSSSKYKIRCFMKNFRFHVNKFKYTSAKCSTRKSNTQFGVTPKIAAAIALL